MEPHNEVVYEVHDPSHSPKLTTTGVPYASSFSQSGRSFGELNDLKHENEVLRSLVRKLEDMVRTLQLESAATGSTIETAQRLSEEVVILEQKILTLKTAYEIALQQPQHVSPDRDREHVIQKALIKTQRRLVRNATTIINALRLKHAISLQTRTFLRWIRFANDRKHTLQRATGVGESVTIYDICTLHRLAESELRALNPQLDGYLARSVLPEGTRYRVPFQAPPTSAVGAPALETILENTNSQSSVQTHRVGLHGETIQSVCVLYGVKESDVRLLNPGLNNYSVRSTLEPGLTVYLPAAGKRDGTGSRVQQKQHFITQEGETLDQICSMYGLSEGDIRRINPALDGVGRRVPLRVGSRIALPATTTTTNVVSPGGSAIHVPSITIPTSPHHGPISPTAQGLVHEVSREGETLENICISYGLNEADVRLINPNLDGIGRNTPLRPGGKIHIPKVAPPPVKMLQYEVAQGGESIASVCNNFGCSIDEFRKLNPKFDILGDHANLPGGTLVLLTTTYGSPARQHQHYDRPPQSPPRQQAVHYANGDEGLADIARQYGVSEDDVRLHNPTLPSNRRINEGTVVKLPQSMTPAVRPSSPLTMVGSAASQRPLHEISREGETLDQICSMYGLSEGDIRRINPALDGVGRRVPLRVGSRIALPATTTTTNVVSPGGSAIHVPSITIPTSPHHGPISPTAQGLVHEVSREGETLENICISYGLNEADVRLINPNLDGIGRNTPLRPGGKIHIPKVAPPPVKMLQYEVAQGGESIASVCNNFGCSIDEFRKLNPKFDILGDHANLPGGTLVLLT
eukprot:PhF_6_TR15421/c2_g1_i2/m.23912